ncbi:MAG TPA: sigma factor-like helix-turn-helix DNA-binding protein [Propionibacteriaceae bacterium]|nr:sigma factor-like helix-turn-helix DNA-binding protein [Propionibacteriaceae bacterium]
MSQAADLGLEEYVEQAGPLAAALVDRPADAAALLGAGYADLRRRRKAQTRDPDTAVRDVVLQRYLVRRRPAPASPPDASAVDPAALPAELTEIAHRLTRLSPVQRATLVLIRWSGLTHAEVAGLIERPVNAVSRLLGEADRLLAADPYAVQATLEELSWRVPALADVRAAAHRAERLTARRQRRIRLVLVAGVLGLIALGAVPVTRASIPLHARPAGEWTYGLQISPPPGWQINSHVVGVDQEYLQLTTEAETETSCQIRANLPSTPQRLRPDALSDPENVWVSGRRAVYSDDGRAGPEVRWTYRPGAQVAVSCGRRDGARELTLQMARLVRFEETPLLLPFAFPPLPAGVRPVFVGSYEGQSLAVLGHGDGQPRNNADLFLQIEFPGRRPPPQARSIAINGVPATVSVDGAAVTLCLPAQDQYVCLVSESEGDSTAAERRAAVRASRSSLTDVARGLRIADPVNDRSRWFDARESFPR